MGPTLPSIKIQAFITKHSGVVCNEIGFSSSDRNPTDLCIWSVLERNADSKPHRNLESLKKSLVMEWDKIPLETHPISVESVPKSLRAVAKNKGGYVESS